ncbi:short chain dehydrogenase [Actinomadura barringtoniae]|uniref:Short chain dehydrogenase n=1 Tax=Actinomadura barringtoniae TaxID=1427535 RepID=A0A939PGL2_9ACTN|nr:short chain dehydrogenase [Actinomadura barringtoniae]MBO2452135.1 short chain dehydrogenase [Actinomadura barringtoniae]
MKTLLTGATGTLGRAVHALLAERGHEVVTAARKNADITVDITDPESIRAMYEKAGRFDALANAAGWVPWKPFAELSHADVLAGLAGKAASQVELVRQGSAYGTDEASFTLITGVTTRDPILTGSVASLANGAVEAFARAAAIELPHRQRVNVVSPTVFTESIEAYGDLFAGFEPVPVRLAALAYVRSIEGHQTGQVYLV